MKPFKHLPIVLFVIAFIVPTILISILAIMSSEYSIWIDSLIVGFLAFILYNTVYIFKGYTAHYLDFSRNRSSGKFSSSKKGKFWKPISTAPRGYTWIIVWNGVVDVKCIQGWEIDQEDFDSSVKFRYWAELPHDTELLHDEDYF